MSSLGSAVMLYPKFETFIRNLLRPISLYSVLYPELETFISNLLRPIPLYSVLYPE